MSKLSKAVSDMNQINSLRLDETVKNFMGGDSYVINPLDTLKMITASSIFGEPAYYRGSKSRRPYVVDALVKSFSVIPEYYEGKSSVKRAYEFVKELSNLTEVRLGLQAHKVWEVR